MRSKTTMFWSKKHEKYAFFLKKLARFARNVSILYYILCYMVIGGINKLYKFIINMYGCRKSSPQAKNFFLALSLFLTKSSAIYSDEPNHQVNFWLAWSSLTCSTFVYFIHFHNTFEVQPLKSKN